MSKRTKAPDFIVHDARDAQSWESQQRLLSLWTRDKLSGLLMPHRERDSYCGGCGSEWGDTLKRVKYCGEDFCAPCVEKWTNGRMIR